jgi:RNA polymerase sigma-70 factor (ECF subfamily)
MAKEDMPPVRATPAFPRVFEENVSFVWRVLEHHGVRGSELEDATQEVFIVVARKLDDLDDGVSVRSWLYGIARRVASSQRRRAHVRREQLTDEPPASVDAARQHDDAERREALGLLQTVLERLPEEQRMAFVLREVEQLTIQEVADAMGCPLQTAYSRVRVAKDHVMAAFREPQPQEVPHAG